ncbi:MAG: 7TM diverse intracellular signaling domain-containing protein [Sedimenticola sp.]
MPGPSRKKRLHYPALLHAVLLPCVLLLVLATDTLAAGYTSRIVLEQNSESYVMGMQMDVLEDPTRSLTIGDVTSPGNAERFTPFRQEVPNWGFSESAYWYRTVIKNPLATEQELILEQITTWIDRMTIYTSDVSGEGGFTSFELGDKLPFRTRKVAHTDFLYPITLQPGESLQLYIRIQSRAAVFTPITIWHKEDYYRHDSTTSYFFGAFFGIIGIMFIYNLFLYTNTRDSNYLFYVCFIFAFGIMFANSKGLTLAYVLPNHPELTERVQTAGLSLFQLCGILFGIRFLNTRTYTPLLHRLLTIVAAGHLLLIGLAFLVPDVVPISRISLIGVQINGPLLLLAGIRAWSRGSHNVRFYLLGWMSGIIGYIFTTFTLLGVLSYDRFIYNGAFIGGLIDMAFLSFALADRIKRLNEQREEARQMAELSMQVATEELEQKVQERTVDLIYAKDEADQANRIKSLFLSRMSHELRTPLNSIIGFTHLLSKNSELETMPQAQEQVSHINSSSQHLLALINDILDISRIESGKMSINIEPVSIRSALDNTIQLVRPIALNNDIQIIDQTPQHDFCNVLADQTRLTQVLLNLLINAIKYNRPEGSVYIMASVDDLRCRLYIADTGPGIAAHQVETIFKPFERLEHGKGEIEGSGIGLTIAKQLMELMNGSIGVTSSPGEGSTFSFELEVTQEQPTGKPKVVEMPHMEQAPYPKREVSSASGEDDDRNIVLYVEDNMINRTLMEHIFNDRPDIHLIMAETAAEGIRLARIRMPLLIMMDIRLPDASGYDALANLQTNERTAHIPVVAVSANVTENDIQRGREAGFIDYLEKPVEIDRLMRLIDLYLTPSEVLPN